jgi:hypothetical protein
LFHKYIVARIRNLIYQIRKERGKRGQHLYLDTGMEVIGREEVSQQSISLF